MEHTDDDNTVARYPFHKHNMFPTLRLAHVPGAQGDNCLMGRFNTKTLPLQSAPALLVSFFYLKDWLKNRDKYVIRDWVIDSGAYSARAQNVEISLSDYIDTCKRLIEEDEDLTEIYALDVIGDWKATKRNTEKMWKAGIPAIPTFHRHEPWDALKGYAADYPKIAVGGMADLRGNRKQQYAEQCFARVWPKPIHGFGMATRKLILSLPWHSSDATSWELGPVGFGMWKSFGKKGSVGYMNVRGSRQNLRVEVEHFLKLEKEARFRWRNEMRKLPALPSLRAQAEALRS